MESLHKDPILTFPSDILKAVRKEYNLDKPGALDRAIDILELWLKKQDHFTKKDFSRNYLERCIIRAKGSVERTKERLDKMCTARSLLPQYYTVRTVKEFVDLENHVYDAICPKPTKDNCRIYILHLHNTENITAQMFADFFTKSLYLLEYLCAYDYVHGMVIILDYRNINLFEFSKVIDARECARLINLALNGYGIRVKQVHVVSSSNLVNVFLSTFKRFLSEKLASRIQVHSDLESLHQCVDKDILPEESGGTESSIMELYYKWADVVSSEDFLSFIKETYEYKINESLRPLKKQNDEFGMAGTFRSLCVD